jgi:hypothetical protein
MGESSARRWTPTVSVALALVLAVLTASPSSAGTRSVGGYYPNGVQYYIMVKVEYGEATGTGSVQEDRPWSEATLVVWQCSGTGNCSNRVAVASTRNYNQTYIRTGNPVSVNHTYQTCKSVRFGTVSYSNYCTDIAANSG